MVEEFVSTKVRARVVIVTSISLFFYIMLIYSLFFIKDIFQSLLFVLLFFISYHFLFIELKKYKLKYFFVAILLITIIESIIIGFDIRQYIASIFVFNLSIFMLSTDINIPIKRKIIFDSLSYFTTGGYFFTVFTAITYSFVLIGMFNQFPFQCQDMSRASSNVVDFFTKPFKIGLDKANEIKKDTKNFFDSSIENTLGSKTSTKTQSKLSIVVNAYREKMINQVVADNTSINMGICDYMLGEINKRYNKPVFQFSLILLMYLLFYPFLRIVYRLMSIVGIIVFKILYSLKVYKIEKVTREVEEIS